MSEQTARAAQRHARRLLRKQGVQGVFDGGDRVLAVVPEKRDPADLGDDLVEPAVDGVPTDVLEAGATFRPMHAAGTSIGLRNYGTGTLGAIVEDHEGFRYGLTNNHVAAGTNDARVLTAVHSPGPADGLGPVIGRLWRFEPISFVYPNLIDAALVRLPGQPRFTHPRFFQNPRIGWRLRSVGRTSGNMSGEVIGLDGTVDIDFGQLGLARFTGQVLTSFMLRPGDSGSVFNTVGGFACGLGFAGSSRLSIANPIVTVLRTLAVRT